MKLAICTDVYGHLSYPDIQAGLEGVRWLENCVRSADAGAAWVDFR